MRFGQSAVTAGRKFAGWFLLLSLLFISALSPVPGAESPKRVFLLNGLSAADPSERRTAEAFKRRLKEQSSEDIEVLTDFLDLGQFQGSSNEERLTQFLAAKFAQVKPNVVVAVSGSAVDFAIRHRGDFLRAIPIVYCCAPVVGVRDIPPDIPGVVMDFDWAGTLALAQRLQPNARTLVIIAGAPNDRRRDRETLGQLQPFLQKYNTRYLTDLPYDELLKQVSLLPRDSIVLMRRVFQDGSGRVRGADIAEDVSKASTAPVYTATATYFGSGTVGGRMDSFRNQGSKVADLVLDILAGKASSTLPHQATVPLQYRVDARQLERWGFSEAALPPGTIIEFRQPTLWEQHRNTVILALLAFAVLIGLIALLLIEIRKRYRAEEVGKIAQMQAELRRKEVTHLMRVEIVSELSGGIAHELGQPLAAILANAQAAQQLIATNRHDRTEIVEILEDIVEDDRHAGEVIDRLRSLLKKADHKAGLINLNDQITSTLGLVHSELVSRRIKVRTNLDGHLPHVMGDRVQLQQVFLNLMMNAMDAMASMPASERPLSISTRSTEEGNVELSITDRGPGMSPDQLKSVFEPFFTTKQDGLGLGLAICWRIVKSHNGQLTISNAGGGGVTALVSLPVAIRLAAAS